MITLVACTDIENGIGTADGELLFKLPRDMEHFFNVTEGKIVVMGRKTWDSLHKKPLPKRKNYVVTSDKGFVVKGATKIVDSIEEVIELGKKLDIFVIGGGEIYSQTMKHADRLIITHVHTINSDAEVFFPEIDVKVWKLTSAEKHEADEKNAHPLTFATYDRK